MKAKIMLMITIMTTCYCQSQTIYNLEDNTPLELGQTNYYLKDTNNLLDQFVGTWIYTNGSDSITMILKKKIHFQRAYGNRYEDLIYGVYSYSQNGTEILNNLPQLDDTNITNFLEYPIEGKYFPSNTVFNNDPNVSGYVLDLSMKEPNDVLSTLQMYVTTVNGVTALRVFKDTFTEGVGHLKGTPHYETVMPQGYLTFMKQ